MEHVRLGSSGLKVSRLCLGMMSFGTSGREWRVSEDEGNAIIRAYTDAGGTFFDTADGYNNGTSEEVTGRLLRDLFPRRDDYVLATKVYFPTGEGPNDRGLSRKHIMDSIDSSLRRLGTDFVDLYQIHRFDHETPIEETMEALNDVVRAGKARYLGASSMYAWEFAKAQFTADLGGWTRFVSMQNHYNLLYREEEREMQPFCLDQGVGTLPWSPLARGLLARPRGGDATARATTDPLINTIYPDPNPGVIDAVNEVAADRGVPPARVALAWILRNPAVTAPIVGATRRGHVTDAVAATTLTLTDTEVARLEAPYAPAPVRGH
ncbi:aldo/keto reductase [Spiractinospora alimapuensis]|uniref:aldo/keto reductase n=1 Tax=Spiractinospora alimapuensis TaxID=2820884 RepID=UPI001F25F062|nr:aldo/keto reductase [Spiractinospora alimapuensis]QVQ53828.1 aldo/keto reductase [Spiractinospora alimapuensis]